MRKKLELEVPEEYEEDVWLYLDTKLKNIHPRLELYPGSFEVFGFGDPNPTVKVTFAPYEIFLTHRDGYSEDTLLADLEIIRAINEAIGGDNDIDPAFVYCFEVPLDDEGIALVRELVANI